MPDEVQNLVTGVRLLTEFEQITTSESLLAADVRRKPDLDLPTCPPLVGNPRSSESVIEDVLVSARLCALVKESTGFAIPEGTTLLKDTSSAIIDLSSRWHGRR